MLLRRLCTALALAAALSLSFTTVAPNAFGSLCGFAEKVKKEPRETAPREVAPKEIAPKEISPKESAPKEGQRTPGEGSSQPEDGSGKGTIG